MSQLYRQVEYSELDNGLRSLATDRDDLLEQLKGEISSMHYDTPQELVGQIQLMAGTMAILMNVAKRMCENEYLMRTI